MGTADFGTYFFYTIFMLMTVWASKSILVSRRYLVGNVSVLGYYKVGFAIFIILYGIIIGLRYDVGQDYLAYLGWFKELKYTGKFPIDTEIAFLLLNKLVVISDLHFSFLFIFIALIQIIFLTKALARFQQIRAWFFFSFFTFLMFFTTMNIMRQTIAFFVFFYALPFFFEKKYWRFCLFFVLAFSFHKSIVILFLLVPVLKFNWYKNTKLQIVLLVASIFILPQLFSKAIEYITPIVNLIGYGYYVDNIEYMKEITKDITTGDGFGIYMYFIIDLIIILHSKELKEKFKSFYFNAYYNMYFTGILIFGLFSDVFVLVRVAEYFTNFRILILSFLCYDLYMKYKKEKSGFSLSIVIFICLCSLAFFYKAIFNGAAKCSPFQFVFNQ